MKNKPILHLNLKKKWFDMIESGEKTEEYREMTPSWSRIFKPGIFSPLIKIKKKYYSPNEITICFSNGYRKDRRQCFKECIDLKTGTGKEEWGALPGVLYFILKLQ
jgi:hypothetical protein